MKMVVKRPLEQIYYPGPFKQPKQLDGGKRLTLYSEDFSSHESTALVDSPGEGKINSCKFYSDGTFKNEDKYGADLAKKDLGASVPSSLPTSSDSEDDTGCEDSFWSCYKENKVVRHPLKQLYYSGPFNQPNQLDYGKRLTLSTEDFPTHETTAPVDSPDSATLANKEMGASVSSSLSSFSGSEDDTGSEDGFWSRFDFTVPRRPLEDFEDTSKSFLNCPIKEIPIGPNHQAVLPQWNPNAYRKEFSGSGCFVGNDRDNKLMGTCVIPMPDLNDLTIDGARAGSGRTNCSCLDVGSIRCIQLHVQKARENCRKTLGDDKFKELGFCEMGEEVSSKWTADDENIFHKVIYSNPVSHGRNFWKYLSAVFPSRTSMEIVSYYFNVFMLRKRAVQNRSDFLEVDSDDDEEPKDAHVNDDQNRSYLLEVDHSDFYQHKQYLSDLDTYDEFSGSVFKVPSFSSNLGSGEDEESIVESFDDPDLDSGWIDDEYMSKPECNHGISDKVVCEKVSVQINGGRDGKSGEEAAIKIKDDCIDS